MKKGNQVFSLLAEALEYPQEGWVRSVESGVQAIAGEFPSAEKDILRFYESVARESLDKLEETYTQTFDFNPTSCLYAAYQIRGENHKRNSFMAKLNGIYKEHGYSSGKELPDHLPTMLKFLALLGQDNDELKITLLKDSIVPAVKKLDEVGFKESKNYYKDLVCASRKILEEKLKEAMELKNK